MWKGLYIYLCVGTGWGFFVSQQGIFSKIDIFCFWFDLWIDKEFRNISGLVWSLCCKPLTQPLTQFDVFPLVPLPLLVTGSYCHGFLPGQETQGIFVSSFSGALSPSFTLQLRSSGWQPVGVCRGQYCSFPACSFCGSRPIGELGRGGVPSLGPKPEPALMGSGMDVIIFRKLPPCVLSQFLCRGIFFPLCLIGALVLTNIGGLPGGLVIS